MSAELVRVDTFADAWERFSKEMPDEFRFEIDYYYLLGLSLPVALDRQRMMRVFTKQANDAGYSVTYGEDFARAVFIYQLKRRSPKPEPAPKAINELARDGVIDV